MPRSHQLERAIDMVHDQYRARELRLRQRAALYDHGEFIAFMRFTRGRSKAAAEKAWGKAILTKRCVKVKGRNKVWCKLPQEAINDDIIGERVNRAQGIDKRLAKNMLKSGLTPTGAAAAALDIPDGLTLNSDDDLYDDDDEVGMPVLEDRAQDSGEGSGDGDAADDDDESPDELPADMSAKRQRFMLPSKEKRRDKETSLSLSLSGFLPFLSPPPSFLSFPPAPLSIPIPLSIPLPLSLVYHPPSHFPCPPNFLPSFLPFRSLSPFRSLALSVEAFCPLVFEFLFCCLGHFYLSQ